MFSLTNAQKILEINAPIFSPLQIDDNIILCSLNGQIIKYSQGQLKLFTKINGQIRSIAYDLTKNTYYVADNLKHSIIAINISDTTQSQLVNQYQGISLNGPNTIIVSDLTGNIYFTDSGSFGQNIHSKGSVFMIDIQQQSIRPLILKCLKNPSGIAFSHNQKIIYISETGNNRILRFYQSKQNISYFSVFHQFNGRFGPTSIVVTNINNYIIVALFQFKNILDTGCLGILNQQGILLQKLKLPQCGPQLSGLFISRQTDQDLILLITQNSTRQSCHKMIIKIQHDKNHKL